ncbi:MAG: hypothetical protein QG639_927 [Patescibacteria group bacterium]|nr:hypothetical protein [Patescibacteria group bacterium]
MLKENLFPNMVFDKDGGHGGNADDDAKIKNDAGTQNDDINAMQEWLLKRDENLQMTEDEKNEIDESK